MGSYIFGIRAVVPLGFVSVSFPSFCCVFRIVIWCSCGVC